MFHGKMKAVTFSYDDGATQDRRLVEIFNKYNLKATFNLNSELFGNEDYLIREGVEVSFVKVKPEEVAELYKGHEVAVHTLTHPHLTHCSDEEIIRQVEEDRKNLEALVGYEVVGMAYPGGGVNNDEHVAEVIRKHTNIRYARTITSTKSFEPQTNLYRFNPTTSHTQELDDLFALSKAFVEAKPDHPQILYIWGHSFEFDVRQNWDQFEELCVFLSNREDIFYGTNREILLG